MGGQASKSTYKSLNETAVSASMRTIQSCTVAATQEQTLQLVAAGDIVIGDITQIQATSVNTECLFSAQKKSDIAMDVATQITNKLEAQGSGVMSIFGTSRTEVQTNLTNRFSVALNMDSIQTSVTSTMQKQVISLEAGGNIIAGNVTQQQTAEIIAKAMMNDNSVAAVIQDIATKVDNNLKSSNAGTLSTLAKYIAIIVVVVIIGGILAAMVSAFSGSNDLSGTDLPSGPADGELTAPQEANF